jgi:opacity protein-like surface antigen
MKLNYPIVICSVYILNFLCFGQDSDRWGVLGGMTASNLTYTNKQTEESNSFQTRNGLRIGVFGEVFNYSYFNLYGDLSYVQRGTRDDDLMVTRIADNDDGYETIGTLNQRFDYISMTLLGKGKYRIGLIVPYVFLGPSISYLVGGNDQVEPWIDLYNKFILGITLGYGAEIDVTLSWSILIELRYYQDLSYSSENDHSTYKNHSYEYLIGIKF